MKMKIEVKKVEMRKENGWKSFNKMRNEDGVKQELEKVADEIGELETSYHAITRAVAVAKVDKSTLDSLISQGKAKNDG